MLNFESKGSGLGILAVLALGLIMAAALTITIVPYLPELQAIANTALFLAFVVIVALIGLLYLGYSGKASFRS